MYVEGSGSSVSADGVGVGETASVVLRSAESINVDMTKWRSPKPGRVSYHLYASWTVISPNYIDSKHNKVEIHREVRGLSESGNETKKMKDPG